MDLFYLVAGFLVALTFFAHIIFGTKESLNARPNDQQTADRVDVDSTSKKQQYWMQSMCAFQLVTVDLFIVGIILFAMGLTEVISFETELAYCLAVYFFLWAIAWLVQLSFLKKSNKQYYLLGQWAIFMLIGGLILGGALG